jgi:hypothetical protein
MTPANLDNIIQSSSMDPRFRGDDELGVPPYPHVNDTCKDWQRHLRVVHGSQPSAG